MNSLAAHSCDTTTLWKTYRLTKCNTVKMELAMRYIDIARSVARQMRSKATAAIEEDDLVQIGVLGIGEAIDHYDDSRGAQFETYAMLRVRWAILDELRKLDWVPRYTRDKFAAKQKSNVISKQESKVSAARSLGKKMEEWDRNEYHTGTANMFEMVSLQTPVKDKDGEQYTTLGDSLASPDSDVLHGIMHEEMKEEVSRIVESLPVSQNTVLRMHYYQNVDMQDIAKTMGISPSRVSQLHRSAMNAMKERLRDVVY